MTTRKLAAQYISDQIEIIKKHGEAPRLTADQRRRAIADAQKTFDSMRERAEQERPAGHQANK
jgi:hypothetical protein